MRENTYPPGENGNASTKIGNKFIQIIYVCVYICILCKMCTSVSQKYVRPKCHIKHFTVSCNLFYCQLSNRKADIWNFNIQYERKAKNRRKRNDACREQQAVVYSIGRVYKSFYTHTHAHTKHVYWYNRLGNSLKRDYYTSQNQWTEIPFEMRHLWNFRALNAINSAQEAGAAATRMFYVFLYHWH